MGEVPRHWRLKDWRYALRVPVCGNCGRVQSECPAGIRDFVEGAGGKETSAAAMVFEGLAVGIPLSQGLPSGGQGYGG